MSNSDLEREIKQLKNDIETRKIWDKQQAEICAEQHKKLEKIKSLTENDYSGDGLDLNNDLKKILKEKHDS